MSNPSSEAVSEQARDCPAGGEEEDYRTGRPGRLPRSARRSDALRVRRQRRQGAAGTGGVPAHHGRSRGNRQNHRGARRPHRRAAEPAPDSSGGAIPRAGGVLIGFSRMNRILEIDIENERAVLQPGVVNLDITLAVQALGYFYAPDPSSQRACTIGGNVAENSGGPHTLAYGVTTNHVLGLEFVMPDGTVHTTGGKELDLPGYDITGLLTGSEGTMALVTKIIVRLMRQPEKVKTHPGRL